MYVYIHINGDKRNVLSAFMLPVRHLPPAPRGSPPNSISHQRNAPLLCSSVWAAFSEYAQRISKALFKAQRLSLNNFFRCCGINAIKLFKRLAYCLE